MMATQVEFSLSEFIITSDGYIVNLKGFYMADPNTKSDEVVQSILKVTKDYISEQTLMDTLDIVNNADMEHLKDKLNQDNPEYKIEQLKFSTVDASELGEGKEIGIDPSLENQSQKRGLLSRLFRRK